jgi:hypothetical protein
MSLLVPDNKLSTSTVPFATQRYDDKTALVEGGNVGEWRKGEKPTELPVARQRKKRTEAG